MVPRAPSRPFVARWASDELRLRLRNQTLSIWVRSLSYTQRFVCPRRSGNVYGPRYQSSVDSSARRPFACQPPTFWKPSELGLEHAQRVNEEPSQMANEVDAPQPQASTETSTYCAPEQLVGTFAPLPQVLIRVTLMSFDAVGT
jgi:hypothetical protein